MADVRFATLKDLTALVQLSGAAVGSGDYVLRYLEEMIAAREILVADDNDRIAAMIGVTPCLDRALWLGQARTHPDFQRQGRARSLIEAAGRRARREGRPALRLWTSERNMASRRLAEAAGFRRVAVFTRRVARTLRRPSGLSPSRHTAVAFRLWRQSLCCRRGRGYVSYQWHFLPLSHAMVKEIAARTALLAGQGVALVLWTGAHRKAASALVLAGGQRGLVAARRAAGERGYATVHTFLPRDRRIARWARLAGSIRGSWGTAAVLYERPAAVRGR